ncbi:MAG: plastocyanin/azurin family copper-binding protein [Candidatus Eisenbacteria bacterium]
MTLRQIRSIVALSSIAALLTLPALAGQVRVNVSSNAFTPRAVNINVGDHVVWIWTGGTHSVTSGDSATNSPSGFFNTTAVGPTSTFSFLTSTVQIIPYYCIPHAPAMAGQVIVQAGGNTNASDFRISEVMFAGGEDRVEIANLGASGDLSKYRLKISGQSVAVLQIGTTTNISSSAGSRIVLHLGTTGTNSTTDLFFSALSLPDAAGSVALYVPNTVTPSLALATQIIDFVQWGASAQENEATANTVGYWASGSSVNNVAPGHSIEFCGTPGQYGVGFWSEVAIPNFGSNGGCSTPTVRSTWGRIKSLYR